MTLSIKIDDEWDDWFSFYREQWKIKDLAWDNSCFEEDINLSCFVKDYNFGRRMLKRYK